MTGTTMAKRPGKTLKVMVGNTIMDVSIDVANKYFDAEAKLLMAKVIYKDAIKSLIDDDYMLRVRDKMMLS